MLRQPVTWAVFAGALSLTGPRGRRAVLRGLTCSAIAAAVQFPFKLVFRRPRPLGARLLRTERRTSAFPSGHTASDLSFMFAASQEIPLLIAPLSAATLGSHWSLMRSRIHYPSDIIAGGVVAVAVTGTAWKLWPPSARRGRPPARAAGDHHAPASDAPHPRKRAVMRFVTNRMLNPLTRPLLALGLWPRTQALIETTGRTSGQPRTVPVGNGLRGDAFWIVTEHGYSADNVKNIQHDPRMRVKVGRHWHHGTAHILTDDDPRQRLRWLKRPVNDALLLLIGTQQLTIRVDLEATERRPSGP
ncbi:MAG TPA: nitroreductase/quinone reductase family protein [Solirubrobacteraceae bacterium]|nr:nitroreductase/quinone reductase family protein [Solirubrobacteraceae bacterium]